MPAVSLDLVPLVRSLAADAAAWRPHVRYDRTTRYWSRLPSPSGVDVWLLTWLPDQGTELHDHGASAAALTVVEGRLLRLQAAEHGALASSWLSAGDSQWVAPGVVHDVVNRSRQPAVSIHAYAPALTRMTFWSAAPTGLRPVRQVFTSDPEVAA